MKPLPPNSDKKFWGDNEVLSFEKTKTSPPDKHYFEWQGPYAVCVTCPNKHTVPINPATMDIIDGEIVIKD